VSSRPKPPPKRSKRHRDGVDLVLLDFRLPDADGLSVLKQIKEHDPDTLVILLGGFPPGPGNIPHRRRRLAPNSPRLNAKPA
jgi:FixJ family two-component response regulator